MSSELVVVASLALLVVVLATILGAIEGRERFSFVGGMALFIIAHTAVTSPPTVATALASVGILLAVASTIPLLRQSV